MASSISLICIIAVFYTLWQPWHVQGASTDCQEGVACDKRRSTSESPTSSMDALFDYEKNRVPKSIEPWNYHWPALLCLAAIVGIIVSCIWCAWNALKTNVSTFSCMCAVCVPLCRRGSSHRDSTGSCYPPPRYSRCSSLHRMPPPYSEVTSKPDQYPLVISCGRNDKGDNGYLMVQYYKNKNVHTGTISETSTADSLNSVCTCNATNEANSIIPPPYSFANNYEDWQYNQGGTMLRSVSSLTGEASPHTRRGIRDSPVRFRNKIIRSDMSLDDSFRHALINSPDSYNPELMEYSEGLHRPKVGSSPSTHRSPVSAAEEKYYEMDRIRRLFSGTLSPDLDSPCVSPPLPISPTERPNDFASSARRRADIFKKVPALCKASIYMSFSPTDANKNAKNSTNVRASSRSAPTTPNIVFGPVISFPTCVNSSSRSSEEESDPLLNQYIRKPEHKF